MKGIYRIDANDSIYIGSSKNIERRWGRHIYKLENNSHHSAYMQSVYNMYGLSIFKFSIIEEVLDESMLEQREQFWLDWLYSNYDSEHRFNGTPVAGYCKQTKEMRANTIKRNIERNSAAVLQTPESRAKAVEAFVKNGNRHYSLRAPNGELYDDIRNLDAFAREHGLYPSGVRNVLSGKISHHKGWTKPENRFQPYAFISPDGVIHDNIVNLCEFCRLQRLSDKSMHKVWKGERNHHKGWKKYTSAEDI